MTNIVESSGMDALSAEIIEAHDKIWSPVFSFANYLNLRCAIQLDIPDLIDNYGKTMSLSELTNALPINPLKGPYIHRLMRSLAKAGFFTEEQLGDNKEIGYALTVKTRVLLKNEPLNIRASVLSSFDLAQFKAWNAMSEWFQNEDRSPFETAHNGKKFYEYCAEDSECNKNMNQTMASDSLLISKSLIKDHKLLFEGLNSMIDVGGGNGTIARAIAKTFPGLSCTVLDLPHVVANLEQEENLNFVGGDMFENIPPAHAIFLRYVLHNWNDEDCVKILKNCKKAIPEKEKGGKVIVIEILMDSGKAATEELESYLDMGMLVFFDARERTEKEFANLFQEAEFTGGYKIFPMSDHANLIVVYP